MAAVLSPPCHGHLNVQALAKGVAVEKGCAPFTVGVIIATSLLVSWAVDHDFGASTQATIIIFSKTNPLIVVFAAGVLGYFGIV